MMNKFIKHVLPHYKWLIKNSPRLSGKTAHKIMEWSLENNITTLMLWKIPSRKYSKWYKNNKQHLKTTLQEETIYIVSSNNKAFGNYGGYSIFANSLGDHIMSRHYSIDRIEHYPCEWAIIIYMEEHPSEVN